LDATRKALYGKRQQDAADFGLDDADEAADDATHEQSHPDLASLETALDSLPPKADLIVAVMPSHFTALLKKDRMDIEQCKREIAGLVEKRRGTLADFRVDSSWTRNDENFFDENHFRVGLAQIFIHRLKEAAETKRDAEDGVYRVLTGGGGLPRNADAALETSSTSPAR